MLTTREFSYALYGAYLLARRNPTGLTFFDRSVDGCRRSFLAAVMIFPMYLAMIGLGVPEEAWADGRIYCVLLVRTIAYVMIWAALPLAFLVMCRLVDREEGFLGYVTAYNWAQVLQVAVLSAALGMWASGVLPGRLGLLVVGSCEILLYVYSWYIARVALHITGLQAFAFVLLDIVISKVIVRVAGTLC